MDHRFSDILSANLTTDFRYNANGTTATLTDANGNLTSYSYDGYDRLAKTQYPSPTTPGTSSTTDYEALLAIRSSCATTAGEVACLETPLPARKTTQSISVFKDTSLVTIVSMYELTGALSLALNSDVNWRPFKIEAYLFITIVYFIFCFAMSRYSLWVEKQLATSKSR